MAFLAFRTRNYWLDRNGIFSGWKARKYGQLTSRGMGAKKALTSAFAPLESFWGFLGLDVKCLSGLVESVYNTWRCYCPLNWVK